MNSLTYLSRQFDALASARTPPSTPTTEKQHPFSVESEAYGTDGFSKLKRTMTWSKSLGQGQPSRAETGKSTKRSFSLPSIAAPSPSVKPPSQGTIPGSKPIPSIVDQIPRPIPQRIRRLYLIRTFVVVWNTLCEAWRCLIRNSSILLLGRKVTKEMAVESEMEAGDEKDSDADDFDPIVARAPSKFRTISEHSSEESSYPFVRTEESGSSTSSLQSSVSTDFASTAAVTKAKPSNLLPNPFTFSLLTQTPRSSSPTLSLPSTPPTHPHLRKTPFHLPKTLVLDLDETLIHSTSRPMTGHGTGGTGLLGLGGRRNKGAGHMVEVVLGGRSTLYHVYKRPFVDYFLRKVSGWYTLVIFTASMQEYADPVIDWLDAGRGILTRRFFRESCTQLPSGSYTKDLSLVEQDLSRVCLIDNSPISYNVNQANGIPIEGWTHDLSDEALLDLLPVLDSLRFTSDVRRVLSMRGF